MRPLWPVSRLSVRIAVGFVSTLAAVLIVHAAVLAWTLRVGPRSEGTQEERVARTASTASRVAAILARRTPADFEQLAGELDADTIVVLADGRAIGARTSAVDVKAVAAELNAQGRIPERWIAGPFAASPVLVDGRVTGVVAIVPPPLLRAFGPATVLASLCLVVAGTTILLLVFVKPVVARIHRLQEAAERIGRNDLTARAPTEGADEIAALARTFNAMAEELQRRAEALTASDRVRRQLVADVSHELMTPLTSVLSQVETLLMAEVRLTSAQQRDGLRIAMREGRRLERLIGDLLDAARLDAGGGRLRLERFSIGDVFDEIKAARQQAATRRGVTIEAEVVPPGLTLHADPFRFEQALDNLVVNALDHATADGRILLAARGGTTVEVSVSDSGPGIAPEHLPFIFDRFYKVHDNEGTSSRGSGLGLAIVKAIVERHGATVTATSQVGQGTRVTMTFPIVAEDVGTG
jgi:signal transduction histidine kinase